MPEVKPGSTVTLHYIGTLENGRIFHSTEESGPLTVSIGAGEVFAALEQALLGMRAGEVKNIVLSAADAYGPRLEENLLRLPRTLFPADKSLSVGQKLSIDFRDGTAQVMHVAAVSETEVTLDANHPLAGCELTFALKVVGVE
ncbi:MAG: peptidylprolyl isomerase [Desulfuromonadales bacterium GWD2_61_12]|nr:MAG: peptidylprolyl isomerase [Desulfuromonadales bacterium GWC2_61_20]OGR36626.1 MAG: peptidylprolyl isomerase [Desulfuromonadales bacterium GWD2_61_12]HAD05222.1 peptidylprolyl isomerase [Desulfuromonas sp.]HBT82462.1 peptidylprolyl isomerase [Desulfuromonas sp.]